MKSRAFVRTVFRLGVILGLAAGILFAPAAWNAWASRNSSGTYSLPTGNPVVTGTSISSSWANTTLSDIATEVTDSLNRSGKGGMLAPLKLPSGSSSLPAMTFSSEPSSGLYRAGTADIRMQAQATQVQRWTGTGAVFPLVATCEKGITATNSTANTAGGTFTGNGTAAGVSGTGGGTNGAGGSFTGGATNGDGVYGAGTGSGFGGEFLGGSSNGKGVIGTGQGTGVGGQFAAGTTATGGTRKDAAYLVNGDLSLDGVAEATSTTSIKNRLTPSNLVKAWGQITSGASPTVNAGFNIASVSCGAAELTVNVGQDFANGSYVVVASSEALYDVVYGISTSAGVITLGAADVGTAAQIDLCASSRTINFIAMGAQ